MTNDTTTNASETYQARANDIARLMQHLQEQLQQHASAAKADPKNWSRVGDLGKVRSDLIDLVAFLNSSDREVVEGWLSK